MKVELERDELQKQVRELKDNRQKLERQLIGQETRYPQDNKDQNRLSEWLENDIQKLKNELEALFNQGNSANRDGRRLHRPKAGDTMEDVEVRSQDEGGIGQTFSDLRARKLEEFRRKIEKEMFKCLSDLEDWQGKFREASKVICAHQKREQALESALRLAKDEAAENVKVVEAQRDKFVRLYQMRQNQLEDARQDVQRLETERDAAKNDAGVAQAEIERLLLMVEEATKRNSKREEWARKLGSLEAEQKLIARNHRMQDLLDAETQEHAAYREGVRKTLSDAANAREKQRRRILRAEEKIEEQRLAIADAQQKIEEQRLMILAQAEQETEKQAPATGHAEQKSEDKRVVILAQAEQETEKQAPATGQVRKSSGHQTEPY